MSGATREILLTVSLRSGVSLRTALTKWTSWCVYLIDFVTKHPSESSTTPSVSRSDLDEAATYADVRSMAGRASNCGTLAKFLTERRPAFVSKEMERSQ